ncbi:MAG: amidohydrolase [Xanthomonadales bacterium]|nr:amidohydrolase [Xanthomonadales bacterium]
MRPMMKRLLLTGLVLASPPIAHAQLTFEDIDRAAAEVQPQVVEWRRWFHENPELSNREFNTATRIAEILADMGLEPTTGIAGTGVVAMIEGGQPGPLVAIRADMDGLPVTEETGLPFASTAIGEYNGQEVGVMHACGHDTHMAMALGAAKILNDNRDELPGRVLLIFQPAEEGPPTGEKGGASLMLEEGLFEPEMPEAVFGLHVGIGIPGGQFATRAGPLMASSDRFVITVNGRQTHGARPWDGVDPVVTAAQIVMGLQTIASRQLDVTAAPSIISVGRIEGGVRNNVIPDTVELEGTIRAFDPAMRAQIHAAMERTARSIAEANGATIDWELELGNPPVRNNAALYEMMVPALEHAAGAPLSPLNPQTVAEDFSEYAERTPSLFVFLGNWPEGVDPKTQPTNHSPMFDVHEPWLEHGVRAFGNMVVTYLNGGQ